jgi:archaellum component FlaF (FlaF/FlaG flagellin family)
LGAGTFSASTANPGNIAAPAATGVAATAGTAMGSSVGANAKKDVLEGPNLALTIAETVVNNRLRKLKLTVTNQGTTSVNLNRFKIELQGHQMFRPIQSRDIKFTQTVQPGAQASHTIDEFEHSNCSNFTHYTVTANDSGSPMIFNGRLDLSPPQIAVKFISMTVNYSDKTRGFEQNIGDEFSITVDVTNNSDRWLIDPSAMGTMAVDGGKHPYPFDMPVQLALAPGQKQRIKILFPITQMSAFTTLYSDDLELWRIKPTWANATLYLGSSLYCGVQTMDGNIIHAEWKK